MNVVAAQHVPHGGLTPEIVQRYLDENQQLIMAILENQNIGKIQECSLYQQRLQQNLMMLASLADTHALTSTSSQTAAPTQQNPNVFMSSGHQHATIPTQPHAATPQNIVMRQASNRATPQRNVQQMNYPLQVVNGSFAQPTQIPQQPFVQNPVNVNPALVKQRSQTQPLPQQPHTLLQQPHSLQQAQVQQSHLQQHQQYHQLPQGFVQNQPVTLNNLKTAVRPSQPMMLKQPSQTLQQAPILQQTSVIQQGPQQTTQLPVARPQMLPQQKTQDFYRSQDALRNYVATQVTPQQIQAQQLQQPMSQPMSPQGTPQMGFPSSAQAWASLPQQQQQMLQAQNQRVSKQQLQQLQYQQLQQQQQQKLQQQLQARANQQAQQAQQAAQAQQAQQAAHAQQAQPQHIMQQTYAYQAAQPQSQQQQKASQQLHSVLPADFMVNFQNSGIAESLIQQGNSEIPHIVQNTYDSHNVGMVSNGPSTTIPPAKQETMTQNFMPDNSFGMNGQGMEDDLLGFSLEPNPQLFDTSNTINPDDYLL